MINSRSCQNSDVTIIKIYDYGLWCNHNHNPEHFKYLQNLVTALPIILNQVTPELLVCGKGCCILQFFFFFLNTGTAAYENSFFFLLSRLQDSRKKRKHWKGWLLCYIYHCEYVHGLILTTGGTWKLAKEVASDYWQRWKRADCLDDGFSFWDVQFQVACIKELQII